MRFVSQGYGSKTDSTGMGGGGGESVVGMDGECTRIAEDISNPVSSEARLVPGLVGRG